MKKLLLLLTLFLLCSCAPLLYEPILKGDCVDRAVNIRQQLQSKGYEARIILGIIKKKNGEEIGHAWIEYRNKSNEEWKIIKNY